VQTLKVLVTETIWVVSNIFHITTSDKSVNGMLGFRELWCYNISVFWGDHQGIWPTVVYVYLCVRNQHVYSL